MDSGEDIEVCRCHIEADALSRHAHHLTSAFPRSLYLDLVCVFSTACTALFCRMNHNAAAELMDLTAPDIASLCNLLGSASSGETHILEDPC